MAEKKVKWYNIKIWKLPLWLWIVISLFFISCNTNIEDINRNDDAVRITYSDGTISSQNPAFSPDGVCLIFTRFINGYNEGPSEIVKINIETKEETILFSSEDSDNVNVPGPVWIDGKICWASDRAGYSEEIYVGNDDGTNIIQITNHPENIGYYIEPVFNPTDTNKIIFEHGPSDKEPHRIALVETDEFNRVTYLTDGIDYDDRLPNWSYDGNSILFQRADKGDDNWQVYTAQVDYSNGTPELINITKINQPYSHNTDNSWFIDNNHIISSSDYNIEIPNIYMFPIDGTSPIRVSYSTTNEDGAPSCSYDGIWIAFESHIGQDENTPSDIWIIKSPK